MERFVYQELLRWKESENRKPLVLRGARQVGKTYLLKNFGSKEYQNLAYINCDNNPQMQDVFFDYDIDRIIRNISAITQQKIVPKNTLIVLDEIQEIPKGLASLKYFCENAPEYHIAVAGSLLGIAIHHDTSFPVGKVDTITVYPMSFNEFLLAKGENEKLKLLQNRDWNAVNALKISYIELLRQYYYVGGMPEVVASYIKKNDIQLVRKIQNEILSNYVDDISKHAPKQEVPRINMVWNSIPSQLAKENKKFIYGALKKGARATEFELAIQWLIDCGIVYKISRIAKSCLPLKFYEDFSAFKLFMLDCGLMGAMSATPAQHVLIGNHAFVEYKGAFTEQYVLQQLMTVSDTPIYYYSNENSTLEIDFVIQRNATIIPVEVKAEENLRSKSLKTYLEKNEGLKGVRFSMSGYQNRNWMEDVPLFAVLPFIENIQ